LQKLLQLAKTF